jgi:hypothetical protein
LGGEIVQLWSAVKIVPPGPKAVDARRGGPWMHLGKDQMRVQAVRSLGMA